MSFNKSISIRRRQKDIFKLKAANYPVTLCEQQSTYWVQFKGPDNTPYQKGKWTINLYLPGEYPYKSPSVGFVNKIFHPNIDYNSGSVCLDVINQTWTPMYQLVNIFQIFLPQLLTYPNPASPLNHEAATLFSSDIQKYNKKVREFIEKFALNKEIPTKQEINTNQTQVKKNQIVANNLEDESIFDEGSSLSDHNSLDEGNQLAQY